MVSKNTNLSPRYTYGRVEMMAALIVLSISSAVPPLHGQDAGIVGKWESTVRSDGGIGSTMTFGSDGSFEQIPGAMVDFTYRVDSTDLILTFTNPSTNEPVERVFDYAVQGDSMVQTDLESGGTTRFARVGEPDEETSSIAGKWSFPHYVGVTAYQIFTSDGAMHLRVPFRTDVGRYEISEDSLTVFVEGEDPRTFHLALDRSMITLTAPDGASAPYQKVSW